DLGAEKFFDIKCRFGGLKPEAAVLVATVRALKLNGGADKKTLGKEDLGALERGLPNLDKHIENVRQFGLPVVVALNRFLTDSDRELKLVGERASAAGARVALTEVWEQGGAGAEPLARELQAMLKEGGAHFAPLYDTSVPIKQKIETIVRKVYGGEGADYSPKADRAIEYLESIGLGHTPVCMAKTQYSLTDDATKLGRPTGFRVTIKEVYPSAGAGFVVAQAGDIMTMPGLPKEPAAMRMAMRPDGEIVGLF
ncbi:MAG: formate--tetrahydrofolate ligase, partial [Gemmatimonadota bacterium]|nr:formate--tetrahydrofolate ligase [Gemmatimonadota bacterium]